MPQDEDTRPIVMLSGATGGIGRVITEALLASNYRVSAGVRDVARLSTQFPDRSLG